MKTNINRIAKQCFSTLRGTIENCSDESWKSGPSDYLIPCRLTFHLLQATEATLVAEPDAYDWEQYGFNWETSTAASMWDREEMLSYLDKIADMLQGYVERYDMSADDEQPMYFINRADRPMKALRHIAQHTGEIHAIQKLHDERVGSFI